MKSKSTGVSSRDFVRTKMFCGGECGLNGRLRARKKAVVQNSMFKAREADAGRGRGLGRFATAERKER